MFSNINRSELYLVLSDLCNFSCSNCLNSSGPQASRYRLSPAEVSRLVQAINESPAIECVHFSGGEPSLQLPLIRELQGAIRRPVRYSMTTNAWFARKASEVFDAIKLDEMVVSYDRFHAPFVSAETVRATMQAALDRKIKVTLNVVYERLEDLIVAKQVLLPGVAFKTSVLIQSGKQESVALSSGVVDQNVLNGTCPALEERRSGLEKIIYTPGRGASPCCGPLAFDDRLPQQLLFTSTAQDYSENQLRRSLARETFAQAIERLGLEASAAQFHDRCAACSFIYSEHREAGLPSKAALAALPKYPASFPVRAQLREEDAQGLGKSFELTYIFTGSVPKTGESSGSAHGVESRPWSQASGDSVWTLINDVIYRKDPSRFSAKTVASERKLYEDYLKAAQHGKLYYLNGRLVGAVIASVYERHPELLKPTFHLGFVGYDRERISLAQARWIKNDWLESIASWNDRNFELSSTVDWYNKASLAYHARLGLTPAYLRIGRKHA